MSARVPRLELELQAAIRSAQNLYDADCLKAELATLLARRGKETEAEAVLVELRSRYSVKTHGRVTPWINFAEAILDLRRGRGEEALIKMRRAHALSVSFSPPLAAFAAATLASMYWNRQEPEHAVIHAREALDRADPEDHRTWWRVGLVIGEMFALSRQAEKSQRWFAIARRHALGSGDDLAVGAVQLNLSIIHSILLRHAVFQGCNQGTSALVEDSFSRSSKQLDDILQISEDDMRLISRAQRLAFLGDYEQALNLYEERVQDLKLSSADRRRAYWLADMAWCFANLQRGDEALKAANKAISALTPDTQIDDRAAMHSRLAQVFGGLGDAAEAARHQALADDCWGQYRAFQDRCAALCEPFTHYASD